MACQRASPWCKGRKLCLVFCFPRDVRNIHAKGAHVSGRCFRAAAASCLLAAIHCAWVAAPPGALHLPHATAAVPLGRPRLQADALPPLQQLLRQALLQRLFAVLRLPALQPVAGLVPPVRLLDLPLRQEGFGQGG